ncbi:MAG: 3-methyl-2-oxobutanoate hydroxymethyltransferase [Oligoflexia bacterium]|nr:3-methyl-2-oxobutanoate hydroxymethyltransferase [Oligoflexia bacterium]
MSDKKKQKQKITTKIIRQYKMNDKIKSARKKLQMLTCYDFQTAQLLDETDLDMILVGDSVGNVVLGYETTVEVTIEEMLVFAAAVRRGAENTFLVVDLPFGSYSSFDLGLKNSCKLFQRSRAEALKLEGAHKYKLELIERLTQIGIPIMGHIGLTPQSVNELGGYYLHGKEKERAKSLVQEAKDLENAGAFSIVLECILPEVSEEITNSLSIPTIGIGSGNMVDGEVLVINDLLKMGKERPPKFCRPLADLYEYKKELINKYLADR